MLKIEKTVLPSPEQWEIIIEGMRNPKNSWHLMDSYATYIEDPETLETAPFEYFIGENDAGLMETLAKGGPVHAKYRRMIPVMVTVTAPLYWWKEFDTYKVGTTRNSCSTMHKIHVAPFTFDNFSTDDGIDAVDYAYEHMADTIAILERLRQDFNETQEKRFWRALIQMLPDGYLMKATISLNYEVLYNTYKWRHNHKQSEWYIWCHWIEELPYSEIITMKFGDDADSVGAMKFEDEMSEFCKPLNIPNTKSLAEYLATKGFEDGMREVASCLTVNSETAVKNLKESLNRIYGTGTDDISKVPYTVRTCIICKENFYTTANSFQYICQACRDKAKRKDEGDSVASDNDRG